MPCRRAMLLAFVAILTGAVPPASPAAEPAAKRSPAVEELPKDRALAKIVLVAGSSVYKPGEHEYLAGCSVLFDLLRQSPGVFPVLAVDWPRKPETLEGAKALVMLFDGGDKHGLLKGDRLALVEKLAGQGVGLVQLHQVADYPVAQGDRIRPLVGGAWEKGYSQRAHWVADFKTFPEHPVFRGVTPFSVDDGWLTRLRFVPSMKGVTPLLSTAPPKAPSPASADENIVAWAYERPDGGRSFTFTGGHLHRSFTQEGYRRFLVNGILWAAHREIPSSGAPVALDPAELGNYLAPPPASPGK